MISIDINLILKSIFFKKVKKEIPLKGFKSVSSFSSYKDREEKGYSK